MNRLGPSTSGDVARMASFDHSQVSRVAFELAAFTLFGAAASATDWWLGGSDDTPRRLPRDQFVAHMTTIMIGAINGTARLLGIRFDLDLPVHDAVRREESVG